jgi:hypothetical protein
MIGTPRNEQVLLELRDAATATEQTFSRLIDIPELIAALPEIAARYVTLARRALPRARNELDAAYHHIGGYTSEGPR